MPPLVTLCLKEAHFPSARIDYMDGQNEIQFAYSNVSWDISGITFDPLTSPSQLASCQRITHTIWRWKGIARKSCEHKKGCTLS